MILLSNRKDYYDHLIHQFGRDEKIIFKREFSDFVIRDDAVRNMIRQKELFPISFTYNLDKKSHNINIKTIVFCASPIYLVSCDDSDFELLGSTKYKNEILQKMNDELYARHAGKNRSYSNIFLEEKWISLISKQNVDAIDLELNQLHKLVDCAMLEIEDDHKGKMTTLRPAPLFKDIAGLCEAIPAEQVYQKIQCFIGQYLTNELEPPIEISDKDKIVSHGFDLKSSFKNTNSRITRKDSYA